MTNDRPATAMRPGPPDDSAMDHARGQDLDPDIRRFIRTMAESVARYPGFNTAPYPQVRCWAE